MRGLPQVYLLSCTAQAVIWKQPCCWRRGEIEEQKSRKIGGQRENGLCAGGDVAGGEQHKNSVHREVALSCMDLEDVPGLIPRQQLRLSVRGRDSPPCFILT